MPPLPPAWLYKSKITHCKKFIKYLKGWKEVDKSHQKITSEDIHC